MAQQFAVKLAERGHQVRIFDLPDLHYSFAEDHDTIEVVTGDIREELDLTGACDGIECVVHLVAIMPPLSETALNAKVQNYHML